jgi:hypothetical protein
MENSNRSTQGSCRELGSLIIMQIEEENNWFHERVYNEFNNKFVRSREVDGVESVLLSLVFRNFEED